MYKYSNVSLLICQCNGMGKIIDAENLQMIEQLLMESFNEYAEAEKLKQHSQELGDKAIKLLLEEGIGLESLLIKIKKKVKEDDC